MYPSCFILLHTILLISPTFAVKEEKTLLSSVKSLTLRKDLRTVHNRVSAIPQLKCVGGTAKGLYEIDVLRCRNAGSSYGDEDIQWTCTASLPSEFRLGSTEVSCEGFSSAGDPYVLKGSCGVEYRLMLTKLGEEKYGPRAKSSVERYSNSSLIEEFSLLAGLFWVLFIAVLGWIIYSAFNGHRGRRFQGNQTRGTGGWGGGGGNDDPPPPYSRYPPPKPESSFHRATRTASVRGQGGWNPGFWTGALGGGAAGYMLGNRQQQPRAYSPRTREYENEGRRSTGNSGRQAESSSSSSSSTANSATGYGNRYESSGFGGTSRR